MMKLGHRLAGAATVLAVAPVLGWPVWQTFAGAGIAALTAGGRMSPDCDQYRGWRLADRVLPDEALGNGGPLQHRGITHWWGIPVAAAVAVWVLAPGEWWAWAVVLGWASHLLADFAVGRASPYDHRGPGIPFGPWFWHHGLGLDCGGILERAILTPALGILIGWQTWGLLDPAQLIERSAR